MPGLLSRLFRSVPSLPGVPETVRAGSSPAGPRGDVLTRAMPGLEAGAGSNRWAGVPAPATDPVSLLQRARHMAANHSACSAVVSAWAGYAVASGFVAQPATPDATVNATIAAQFGEWSDRADFDQIGDLGALVERDFRGTFVDGNSFTELILDGTELRLRSHSVDRLAVSMNRPNIQNGIEYDSAGRKVAYHLYRDNLSYQTIRIPADQLLHMFRALNPGQQFGTSWLAPVLLNARELDQLQDALLVSAKVAAMHCAFITDMSAVGGVPYEGQQTGNLLNASLEPGVVRILPGNMDVKFNNPQAANSAMDLARLSLKQIAAGTSTPHWLLDNDYGSISYSSARVGMLAFKRRVEQAQWLMIIPMLLNPIYKRWLALEIATGRLDIPNMPEWYKVNWLPPAFEMVDAERDINAEIKAIDAGLKSRTQSVAERGWDIAQLDKERQQEQQRADELGLAPNPTVGRNEEIVTVTKHDDEGRIKEFVKRRQ